MNKIALGIIVVALVSSIGIVLYRQSSSDSATDTQSKNIEIKDGTQYITIHARGGYSPKTSTAQAGMPTKLIVKTNGTYDCSASLVIRSIGYQKILSQTGEEIIDLGSPQAGTLQGLCSMGMYNFSVNFI